MDAGDLEGNLLISEEEDLSAELRELQDHSSNNSNSDLQLLNGGNLTTCYHSECLYNILTSWDWSP